MLLFLLTFFFFFMFPSHSLYTKWYLIHFSFYNQTHPESPSVDVCVCGVRGREILWFAYEYCYKKNIYLFFFTTFCCFLLQKNTKQYLYLAWFVSFCVKIFAYPAETSCFICSVNKFSYFSISYFSKFISTRECIIFPFATSMCVNSFFLWIDLNFLISTSQISTLIPFFLILTFLKLA